MPLVAGLACSVPKARFTVVIPTYNESLNIAEVLQKIGEQGIANYTVIVVDGASTDGTGDAVQAIRTAGIPVTLVAEKKRMGYAYSIRSGMQKALAAGADFIITMDADMSHDPVVLSAMTRKLANGNDVVIGSRYIAGGTVVDWGFIRRLLSRAGNEVFTLVAHSTIKDLTTGYVGYSRRAVQSVLDYQSPSRGYTYLTELKVLLERRGFKMIEIPITFRDRTKGTSKLSYKIVLESIRCLTTLNKRIGS